MNEFLSIITGMSPYLLLGFLLAGLMHAFVPGKFYTKYLSRRSFRSVLNAALLGIPLPLCSCGVIPTALSLRKEGASKGAVVSFLIATPQTGVDSIVATYSLMGLPFAILRPIVALLTAVFGGALTDAMGEKSTCCHSQGEESAEPKACCCHKHKEQEEEHACCCHSKQRNNETTQQRNNETTALAKLKDALRYAYVDMIQDIGKWLVVGLIVAGFLTVCIPTEYFAIFKGNTLASMLLVLCIAIPMYLCATGSIPIAVALMLKGLTPGAALVMLMAGPACNFASILLIQRNLGTRTMLLYILSIVCGAVFFGCAVDWLQFSGHVDFLQQLASTTCHADHDAGWFRWACSALLALMLVNALVLPKVGLGKKKQCCHGH